MRDLSFIAFLIAFFVMGFKRPFLLVLVYVYIDIVSPQRLTYLLLNTVPISLIAVALAVGGWTLADDKRDTRVGARQVLIVLLMLYCWATTLGADFPVEAKEKWDWVWKTLIFAAFLPLTLRTRLRIESLLLFMILSASSIIIVGGIKTVASGGGGYGQLNLMVDNNSGLYEGSTISAVAVAIIPIIVWFATYGTIFKPDWRVKGFCLALVFACLLIPVGTSTRTGLVCIVLLALLSVRAVKRKALYLAAVTALGLAAVPFLPSAFTDRMNTIKTYDADESASTRLAVWQWTIEYAKTHPFGGGFEAYRGNHIRLDLKSEGPGTGPRVETDKARAFHSAYFEMLGEQGYFGLALWLSINVIGIFRMELLRRRHADPAGEFAWAGPLAGALQTAQIIYLFGAAFVGIAFQPFVYMLIGAQIGLDTYLARKRGEQTFRPMHRVLPSR
ncbi:putative O-glycosylation ligase (exosortase A-associated) [Sphingomonas sp. PP-CE-3G-477]|uniref:putative O-glycosylation ligase, exosortase A system-associated n=1 Tax=Sphingomonas sp. PP-CE-3G-477 TaxID=2135660 RepID=UPI000D37B78F|nr:putative O-glycosylation ligase, exosortase A system-associated [Sphingomonas sp. PP-CE-3G-477]PTQ65637.1 putative O-glycosylation ligase (exosortase A-associated) [Sphingomonas sp. PP-CE-3G-477]